MAKKPGEDDMDQRLRWMRENVEGAYNAVHPQGHDHACDHCVNSGTCIIVCCYVNGLGKVLLKGGPPKRGPLRVQRRDFVRFQKFLQDCMPDFLIQSNARTDLPMPGDDLLYTNFRCGFIHGYPTSDFKWGRKGPLGQYWFIDGGRLTLHIDELVPGFIRGIENFKKLAAADTDLRVNFVGYIIAD